MKISRRLALFASLLAVLCTPNVNAAAEPLNDAQIEMIRQNCLAAQGSMQRLEQSEAVSRRNRGVSYESALRLMAALNSRIAINKLNAPNLGTLTSEVEKKRTEFTEKYLTYNNSFTVTMKLASCREQPVTFYDYLTQTRELRIALSATIDDIDRLLDQYQEELNTLKASVAGAPAPGVTQ